VVTQRMMTEWFEYPETTKELELEKAKEAHGVGPDYEFPTGVTLSKLTKDELSLMRGINVQASNYKKRRWVHNLSQQEVAMRMNEASKMVSVANAKFLDEDTQKRTGLELNPLWQMETLYRSGILSAKDQLTALKELATYTHSKAPNIVQQTNINASPESWLLELAKDEYEVIQPVERRQQAERGSGSTFDARRLTKTRNVASLANFAEAEMAEMESLVDFEMDDDD